MRCGGSRARLAALLLCLSGVGAALLAGCPPPPAAGAPGPPRLVLVSWDGAADWVVDRLLAEGRLPHLARLARDGAAAEHSVSSFPSKTAPGHATLWTGCGPDVHGITANGVPPADPAAHTVLEQRSGFSSEELTAEPLFITASKAGKKVVVLSATQSYPPGPHLETLKRAGVPRERFVSFSGFELEVAAGAMHGAAELRAAGGSWHRVPGYRGGGRELTFRVGETAFEALVYDDPGDPVEGLDRVWLRSSTGQTARLAPREAGGEPGTGADGTEADALAAWSPPFPVRRGELAGNTFFRLFRLAPDGSSLALYQRKTSALGGAHSEAEAAAYLAAYPGFHDDPFLPYAKGRFGTPLPAGGDGTAERRVLELVAQDTALLTAGTRFALESWRPDLLFHYSPMIDSAGHVWLGVLDPESPAHDPGIAARLWPFYARVHELLDAWLGAIREAAPPETVVALVSDHGMTGVGKNFFPNRTLEQAGLLARSEDGGIDLARTRVLMPPSTDFYLEVNGTGHAEGIVPPGEREQVLAAAEEALLQVRDPATSGRVVTAVFRPEGLPGLGIGGPQGGDLYFELAPGVYPRRGLSESAVTPARNAWGEGAHGFWPERRSMHAIFYAAGPGIPAGAGLPPVRHIDVAPTLAALLGIPPPPQACGHAVALSGSQR